MPREGTARGAGAVARRTTRAASETPAATAARKPTTISAPRSYAKPPVVRTDSDDDDSDFSSTCSDNSEEYRPLAFGFVKGGAVRKTGAPQQSKYSMRISEDALDDSGLSLSADEVPLAVTFENGAAKRKCGRGEDAAPTAKTMYGATSDTSTEDVCLPVAYTTGKRQRSTGRGVSANGPETMTEEAEVESVDPEDEMPLNTKLILNLVRRIRMNPKDIPLEAFAYVNWGDENYQEELKPLKRLYEELEAKARQVEKVKTLPQSTKKVDYDARIKEAVMAIPQESAILAKTRKIKAHQMSSRPGALYRSDNTGTSRDAKMGVPASERARGEARSVATKASKGQRQREKKMEASFGELGKLEGSTLLARQPAKAKVKESTMSEAAKKVRRTGRHPNRSATFTDVITPEGGEEIVEDQQANDLPPTSRAQSSLAAPVSTRASRDVPISQSEQREAGTNAQGGQPEKARKKKRRTGGRDPGRSVSFADLPEDEIGEVEDGPSGLQRNVKRKRRAAGKRANNRSCSFTDVIMEAGDEVNEDDTDPRGYTESAAPSATPSADQKQPTKRRTATGRGGTRARDFGDVAIDAGDEMKEKDTIPAGKRAGNASGRASTVRSSKQKHSRRSGLGRSRELSISCLDEVVAGEIHESMEDLNYLSREARTLHTSATPSGRVSRTPRASGPLRRPSMTSQQVPVPVSKTVVDDVVRQDEVVMEGGNTAASLRATRNGRARKQHKRGSQELSISALPEDDVGEIREKYTDKLNATPSTPAGGQTTRGSLPRVTGTTRSSTASNPATLPSVRGTRQKDAGATAPSSVRTSANSVRKSK